MNGKEHRSDRASVGNCTQMNPSTLLADMREISAYNIYRYSREQRDKILHGLTPNPHSSSHEKSTANRVLISTLTIGVIG